MIFSSIVSVLLFGLIVYALLQKRDFPIVAKSLPFVALLGIYVLWFPESTTRAAAFLGIGRGVDLMSYVWILVSGLLILVLHLKLVTYDRRLTELVRFFALQTATRPESDHHASPVPPPG
jgi:small membrane protein